MKNIKITKIIAFFMAVLMILPMVPTMDLTVFAEGESGLDLKDKYVKMVSSFPEFRLDPTVTGSMCGSSAFPEVMYVEDVRQVNSVVYCQVKAAEDYTWNEDNLWDVPEHCWVISTALKVVEYTPSTPTTPEISATVKDANGNDLTVKVEGELPEGAELSVSIPEIGGEKLPNVFDIKVLKSDGTEWQPIDEGKTVTVSISADSSYDYYDIYHCIDYAPAIHSNIEYVPVDINDQEVMTVLDEALEVSDVEGCVIVEKHLNISVVDDIISFATNSFSIYELSGSQFVPGNDIDKVEFDNNSLGSSTDEDTIVGDIFYATADTEFVFETTQSAVNHKHYDTYFTVKKGREYVTLTNETGGRTGFLSGSKVSVKVTIDPNTPAGTELVILFRTDGTLGIGAKSIPRQITIVRSIDIKFDSNLDVAGVTVTGMPNNELGFVTDAAQSIFPLPSNVPTAVNNSDPNDKYEFLGWNTSKAGDGTAYIWNGTAFSPKEFIPSQNITLYAMWKRSECTVTFDHNNGTGTKEKVTKEYGSSVTVPEDPQRPGYIFLGWSASLDGTGRRYKLSDAEYNSVELKSDVTLYAIWGVKINITAIGGTISVQKDGETKFTALTDTNTYGFLVEHPKADVTTYYAVVAENSYANAYFRFTPATSGSTIRGASTGSSMSFLNAIGSTKLSGDVLLTSAGLTTDTTITFTALNKFIVSFETNGGSPVTSVLMDDGDTINLSGYTPEAREGYDFVGWYLTSDFSGSSISSHKVKSDTIFYAKWIPHRYSVTLNKGYGIDSVSGGGEYDYSALVNVSAQLKPGYSFLQWTASGVPNSNSANYSFLLPDGPVELTAVGKLNTYNITYNLAGGTVSGINITQYTVEDGAITLVNPTRIGYVFLGWTGTGLSEPTVNVTIPTGSYGDREYTANWKAGKYSVTWVDAFGNTILSEELDYGTTITNIPANPSKSGYTFCGWKGYTAGMKMPAYDVVVTARWEVSVRATIDNNGTIVCVFDGHVYNGSSGEVAILHIPLEIGTIGAGSTIAFTPAIGYKISKVTFTIGEETSVNTNPTVLSDGSYVYVIPAEGITAEMEITVETTLKQCTISFESNGGSVVSPISELYGTAISKPTDPTKEGYSFAGWYTEPTLENEYVFTTMPADDITLYAKWSINQYTITFNTDGGTPVAAITQDFGTDITKPADPTKVGHTFAGWDIEIPDKMPGEDITITAQWTPYTYTVSYQLGLIPERLTNAGVFVQQTKKYGINLQLNAVEPTALGANFAGWDTDGNGTADYQAGDTYTGNEALTLVAVWTPKPMKVVYSTSGLPAGVTATFESQQGYYNDSVTVQSPAVVGYQIVKIEVDGIEVSFDYDIKFIDSDVNVVVTYAPIGYKITFDTDGTQNVVDYNIEGTVSLSTPTKTGYTFAGWKVTVADGNWTENAIHTGTVEKMYGNVTLTAQWTINQYTIIFQNEDGTVLQSSLWSYGDSPEYSGTTPTKAADAQYTYTFAQWSPEIVSVTGDVIYTATYTATVNKYTITFENEDGTVLQTVEVEYGKTPEYGGATPTKAPDAQYTYTFEKWTPSIESVTGNKTYTAVYSTLTNKYTVIWKNWDGTVLETDEDVPYGSTPEYNGAEPTKPATAQYTYTFTVWTPEVDSVTGDVTYTATFSSTVNTYTVTWENWDETVLETDENVPYGTKPEYNGSQPTKVVPGYTYVFNGWYPEVNNVTGDVTYKAQFTENVVQFTITYNANGGDAVASQVYDIEHAITLSTPTRKGYTFVGWKVTTSGGNWFIDTEYAPANLAIAKGKYGNVTLTAQWTENLVEINYKIVIPSGAEDYGTLSKTSESVGAATGAPSCIALPEPTFKFAGWYDNAECNGEPISMNEEYTFTKPDGTLWADGTTYYAKFEYNLTQLMLNVSTNSDCSLLINIKGKNDSVDLDIIVPSRSNGVIVDGLIIGNTYTITIDTDWTKGYNWDKWSYDNTSGAGSKAEITLVAEPYSQIIFHVSEIGGAWLSGGTESPTTSTFSSVAG
ncbi:MAG: InlB B-repeat-containing protein [Clostridia bacterium]|nr:InlB B-repeat-containing protein [Clostridia bacterium]